MIVKDKTYISLDLKNFKYNHQILSNILKIGIPASLSMLIMSIGLFYNIIVSNTEFSSSAITLTLLIIELNIYFSYLSYLLQLAWSH